MKIVIISFYEVFPPASGVAQVTYNAARFLSGEKYLIHLSNGQNNTTRESGVNIINFKANSENHFIKAMNLSVQFPHILRKIKHLEPEVVILEGASWALYYVVLFYLMKVNRIDARIVYHAHNVEYLLRKQKNSGIIALLTKWAEGIMVKKSDLSFAVSDIDACRFERIYGIKPFVLPNGVDVEKFDEVTDEQVLKIKDKYNLNGKIVLFMGLPSFKPNKEAIDFLVDDVFPFVNKKCTDAKLAIIGGNIEYKNNWLINPGNIPFEEVPVFIKACDVCVAPIFSGSGTRLKILEYMASGKPVISTTKGAEGIAVKDGENIIIADDAHSYIEEILYLMENLEIAKKIGSEGMKLIRANYSWQKIMQDFNKILYAHSDKN